MQLQLLTFGRQKKPDFGEGARLVAEYRLHFLDSGKPVGPVLRLDCLDDQHAIEAAAAVPHVHRMELWRFERRVWTFEAPNRLRETG